MVPSGEPSGGTVGSAAASLIGSVAGVVAGEALSTGQRGDGGARSWWTSRPVADMRLLVARAAPTGGVSTFWSLLVSRLVPQIW